MMNAIKNVCKATLRPSKLSHTRLIQRLLTLMSKDSVIGFTTAWFNHGIISPFNPHGTPSARYVTCPHSLHSPLLQHFVPHRP
jgi:hypothetical protein